MSTINDVNLSRPIVIFLSKNGVFGFARKGTKKYREMMGGLSFLPCASVDTIEEVERIRIRNCGRTVDRLGGSLFILHRPFDGTLEALVDMGREFEDQYQKAKLKCS